MSRHFSSQDIAVVGMGCVLPDAPSPEAYWKNLLLGRHSIRALPESRMPKDWFCSEESGQTDKSYTNLAAFIDDTLLDRAMANLGLSTAPLNRLQKMTLEAAHQASGNVHEWKDRRILISLGCMEQDESVPLGVFIREETRLFQHLESLRASSQDQATLRRFFSDLRKRVLSEKEAVAPTSVLAHLCDLWGIRAEGMLVDAACASSLASIDVAKQRLHFGLADIAVVGGIESNLGPETYVSFCAAKILSKEPCLPFDRRASGISQGEGAVVFVLERLGDALKYDHQVHGIIRACAGSSNGRASSMFSPSRGGQHLVLERAYQNLDPKKLQYIECHATGTPVGDSIELEALDAFLPESSSKIPIGSVKSLIGHTRGAAGAASLLKALLILKHGTIPPSPYFEDYATETPRKIFVNREPMELPRRSLSLLGVSSGGFGGTNYHLVLEEFPKTPKILRKKQPRPVPIVVLAHTRVPKNQARTYFEDYDFKIPPKSLGSIDDLQLQALMAASDALENIAADSFNPDNVSVLAASALGINLGRELARRVRHYELRGLEGKIAPAVLEQLIQTKESFPPVTEDTGPGILNNVIAGRVAAAFDFKGKNFNVDADLNSFVTALDIARLSLQDRSSEMVLILAVEDSFDDLAIEYSRGAVHAFILAREDEASQRNHLPLYGLQQLELIKA